MSQLGNSAGRNKGKKYIKLTGNEIATPEAERKGKRFLDWYGASHKYLVKAIRNMNEDVATDTMLRVYNDIVYKGLALKNYRAYFLIAYHTTKVKRIKEEDKYRDSHYSLDEPIRNYTRFHEPVTFKDFLPALDFDYELYEQLVEQLHAEILEYVRANYSPMDISIFEIYMGLQPDINFSRMGVMLGINPNRISAIISAIKRDLQLNYAERSNNLRSLL